MNAMRANFVEWFRDHFGQLLRYASVSVIATVVGLTVLGVLVSTNATTPGWANVIATVVGTVPSFELNRRWVWGKSGTRSFGAEVAPFAALSLLGLAVSTAAVSAVGRMTTQTDSLLRTLLLEATNVASFGVLWVLQFVILDRLLFAGDHTTAITMTDDAHAHAA